MSTLKTGCSSMDMLMDGGFPSGYPVGVYGAYNVGKSWMCIQLSTMATRSRDEGGLGGKVLYIDTEQFLSEDTFDRLFGYFQKRWDLPPENKEMITIKDLPDIFKLGKYFGIEFEIIQEAQRVSAIAKFPKKESKEQTKETHQLENWIEYSPIYKDIEKNKYSLVVLDSITVPIKGVIPVGSQHLSARSTLENALLAATRTLAHEFKIPLVMTNHGVGMSGQAAQFFGPIKPWGGGSMIYFYKRWIGILEGYKQHRDQFGEEVRRFYRYRWPGLKEETALVLLKKDTGYVDTGVYKEDIVSQKEEE